jgi:hypothetical protein
MKAVSIEESLDVHYMPIYICCFFSDRVQMISVGCHLLLQNPYFFDDEKGVTPKKQTTTNQRDNMPALSASKTVLQKSGTTSK